MSQLLNLAGQLEHRFPPETVTLLRRIGEVAVQRGEAAYLVGGGVRDLILGRPNLDLDIVTEGDANGLVQRLSLEGLEVKARSQFMTFKVQWLSAALDIATSRREIYPHPGALPRVEPAPLGEDLQRRDITVNAIALSLSPDTFGLIIDPYKGVEDLLHARIRALHWSSFRDDATRMLRALRYKQRLDGELVPATRTLIERDAPYIETISPDRLRREFDRIWQEGRPERVMASAKGLGILDAISPPIPWDASLESAFEVGRGLAPLDVSLPHLYLALLGARLNTPHAKRLADRLNLPGIERKAMIDAARLGQRVDDIVARASQPSILATALEPFSPAALQAWQIMSRSEQTRDQLRAYLRIWRDMRPSLTGMDLITMGAPEGPEIGKALHRLRGAWLDGEVTSEEQERALAERLLRKWRGT